jgi:hypothetical protein
MAACSPIELPYGLSRHHQNVRAQGKNVAAELPFGHARFRVLSWESVAKKTATAIDKTTLTAACIQSKAITIPTLLSSRPNPFSISRLLKKRYRMARLQVPSKPMRLPTAKGQRERKQKAQSMPLNLPKRSVGRPRKNTVTTTQKGSDPKRREGSQAQPIVIPEDHMPTLRPELAPISYVDHLLWPSERLVTPEISSFQYTPTSHRSPAIQVPQAVNSFRDSSRKNSLLSYEPFPDTSIEVRNDDLRAQTEPGFSHLRSSLATTASGW